jgi:tRNA/tmRNA/rRNA uracil-C5-methylase (TrmA/RlmC/RlmD family)
MDFVIDFEGRVGLREKGKWWRVIDNHTCFIADTKIEELFQIVRDWVNQAGLSYFDRKYHHGLLRYAVIRTTTTGEAMVSIITSEPESEETQRLSEQLFQLTNLLTCNFSTTVIHSVNSTTSDVSHGGENYVISGNGFITEEINGYTYKITPNAFFQTNPYGAKVLMDTVIDFAAQAIRLPHLQQAQVRNYDMPEPSSRVSSKNEQSDLIILDLYCGSGFFTIPLSKLGNRTVGVEIAQEAIDDAIENNRLNNTSAEFICIPSEQYDWSKLNPDLVILDPPRAGLDKKTLSNLITLQPETVIYISCNYKNFSRDMEKLKAVYDVKKMKSVDMFPHTPHVELITLLQKRFLTSGV